MMNSLDLLIIVFMAMSAVSLLAICLMFLVKHPVVKKVSFYFLALQGMLVAWLNAMMTPFTFPGELAIGWGLGALSVAALLMVLLGKNEKLTKIARVLVTVSVVAGMMNAFIL